MKRLGSFCIVTEMLGSKIEILLLGPKPSTVVVSYHASTNGRRVVVACEGSDSDVEAALQALRVFFQNEALTQADLNPQALEHLL
jgi:hypothetical protein